MNNTSSSSWYRNLRVKAAMVEEVLQFIFVIVICIWLLYQIRSSCNGEKIRSKLNREHAAHSTTLRGRSQRLTAQGDSQHEDNTKKKFEYIVNRTREEFQTDETEISEVVENLGGIVYTFHDENGIPEDVRDVHTTTELNDEVENNPHLEANSSSRTC